MKPVFVLSSVILTAGTVGVLAAPPLAAWHGSYPPPPPLTGTPIPGGPLGPGTAPGVGGGPTTPGPTPGPTTPRREPRPDGPTTPGGTPPPPDSGGTPPSGGPTTGGPKMPSAPSGGTPPRGGPAPASGPAAPTSGGGFGRKNRGATESTDRWELWWQHNQDPFLVLRARSGRGPQSGADGFLSGMGRREADVTYTRPTIDEVREQILPAFTSVLGEDEAEIVDSAILAIGRVASEAEAIRVFDQVRAQLRSPHPTVRQSAILALGILGHRAGMPILWEIMNDTRHGRAQVGTTGSIQSVDRAFAALSLGFVCGPQMTPQLVKLIERLKHDDVEVVAGAVLSLGMVKESAAQTVPFLASLLADVRVDRRIQAQVPIALGRLEEAASATVPLLLKEMTDRRADPSLRHSCAIALGRLASPEDVEVVTTLRKLVSKESDASLRHFSIIALGRIGARALSGAAPSVEAADRVKSILMLGLADPDYSVDAPWHVLAISLFGRCYGVGTRERGKIEAELIDRLKRTNNPSDVGALAVGLGMLESPEAGAPLLDRLETSSDPDLLGHVALALGMIGHEAAADELVELLVTHNDPNLRVEVATGLALLGESSAADRLVDMMRATPSFAITASIGRALGRVGDRRSIEPLVALVRDRTQSPAVRGFSCVALGRIAEKSELPWNAPLSIDSNYVSGLRAQAELLSIF